MRNSQFMKLNETQERFSELSGIPLELIKSGKWRRYPDMVIKAKEILIRARSLIENPAKWIKGPSGRCGEYCALNAIFAADFSTPVQEREAIGLFIHVIREPSIAYWNDRPERTHQEVLNAFDQAISLAE